jgi:TolA-binding protein
VHFAAERFDVAAQTYRQLARERGPGANDALFNAGLAWLQASDDSHVAAAAQELKDRGADDGIRGDLVLEKGLLAASRNEPAAAAALREFARDFPKHARAAEAWVALAELAFHAAPPQLEEARQHLDRAAASNPSPAASERADYLRIWLEEAGAAPNEANVIARATGFLQKHGNSPLVPDVRLKLAETYFRRQDFAGAQTQFELLAQRNAESPIAEKALFFAARSAAKTMGAVALDRALVLFEEVVKRNGALRWAARNEQAVIERKLDKPQDALALYEEVIGSAAAPAEIWEALCGKADVLYELGATDSENYRRARAVYDQLAVGKDVPAHWRNQALFKQGVCLEKLGRPAEALEVFYRIMEDELRPGKQREYSGSTKRGSMPLAARGGFEVQPAAAIYEKLAFAGGARSEEAKSRSTVCASSTSSGRSRRLLAHKLRHIRMPRRYEPLLLLAAALLAYHNSFGAPFVFDDVRLIVENEQIRALWPPHHAVAHTSRPLVQLSLRLTSPSRLQRGVSPP